MHERQAWSQRDTRLEQPHCIHAFGEIHNENMAMSRKAVAVYLSSEMAGWLLLFVFAFC
jgi:hypothetical protein